MPNINTRIKLFKRVITKELTELTERTRQNIQNHGKLIDQSDYQNLVKLYNHEYIQDVPDGREWAFLMGCKASILAHLILHIIDHPKLTDMFKCLELLKQRYLIEKHYKIRNCSITQSCTICSVCSLEVLDRRLWNIVCSGALRQKNINDGGSADDHVCVEKDLPPPIGIPLIDVVRRNMLEVADENPEYPENVTGLPEKVDWPILRETLDCYILEKKTDVISEVYLDEID